VKLKICLLSASLLASYVVSGQDLRVLRLAHGLDTKHPVHKAMEFMSQCAYEASDGTLKIAIYPSEQLGNEKECIEALQLGYLAMTKISTGPMEAFVEDFKIFGLPYIFRDSEHFWAVCNGEVGKELLAAGESVRLKGLCYYDAGARSFYANKPINTPEDLAGLKVRVMNSPMAFEMVSTIGGSPTPISWGELYTSLDQGVVDAAENNPPSLFSSRHYEVCRYFSLDEHVRLPDMLVISTRVWASLSEKHKEILQQACEQSVGFQRKIWTEAEQAALEVFEQDGVEIIYPDKQPFVDAVQPMWKKYSEGQFGELIKKIQETK
jgi:tripartite ATP-independent transporter DctP family solute receptor